MRNARVVVGLAMASATIALVVPITAGAALVANGTLDLKGGSCVTATHCLLVGDDDAGQGAVVPLSEVQSQSKAPACESDAKTVGIAVAAFEAENPGKLPTTSASWKTALLGHKFVGGPFLSSWPNENARYYTVEVAGTKTGRTTGDHVKTFNGDVLVVAVLNAGRTYDATVNPQSSCQHLNVVVSALGTEVSDSSTDGIVGVACPATKAVCYGVTENQTPSEGGIVAIDVSSPAHPTVTATDPVALTTSLSAITCPTSDECVAVGSGPSNNGEVVPIVNGVVGSPVSDANQSFDAIACASSSLCVAAGTDVNSNEGVIVPIHLSPSPTLGTPVDVLATQVLGGVVCPAPGSCDAVGEHLTASKVLNGAVLNFSVVHGVPKPEKLQSLAGSSTLSAMECLGAAACDAVGRRTGSPGSGVLVGVSGNRTGAVHTVPGTTSLFGITCISSSLCFGLGTGASPVGAIEPLAATIETTTSLRASSESTRTRHPVAYTATVAPLALAGVVDFTSGGSTIAGCGAVAVRAGAARCVATFGTAGTDVVRASYSGDATELRSTSKPLTESVAK